MTSYYLDVNATVNGAGNASSDPYNSFLSFKNSMQAGAHHGYVARGTEVNGSNLVLITGGAGWELEAYGAGARPIIHALVAMGNNSVSIHDVDFNGSNTNAATSYLIGGNGTTPYWDCEFYNMNCTNKKFMNFVYGGGRFSIHDFRVNCRGSAMNFEASPANKFGDTEIYNFYIDCNNGTNSDGLSIHTGADANSGGTGWKVHNGTIVNCAENCLDLTACGGGQFYQLYLNGKGAPTIYTSYRSTGVHVHHCYITGSSGNGEIADYSIGPNYYYKNLIRSTGSRSVYIADYSGSSKTNFFFEGNTIVSDGGESMIFRFSEENGATIDAATIQNNIITCIGSTLPTCFVMATGFAWNDAGLTCQNNIFYNPAGAPVMASGVNWATWNGVHAENGSADPLLVDRTFGTNGDYRDAYLNLTLSPALNAGSYTATGTYYKRDGTAVTGLTNVDDFVGTSANGTLDIGFFEYVTGESPPVPPTVLTKAVSSITTSGGLGNGSINASGDATPTVRGFRVNTVASATGATLFNTTGTYGVGNYTDSLTSLNSATTYYVQAYATSTAGTGNGSWVSFQTSTPSGGLTSGLKFSNVKVSWL